MSKKPLISFICLIGVIFGGSLGVWWLWDAPLLSPLTDNPVFQFLQQETPPSKNRIIYGFLPYWNLNKTTLQPETTHLSYFSLTMLGDGSIQTIQDGYSEPGFNKLRSEEFLDLASTAQKNGTKVELVLSQFDNDDIVSLLSSDSAQDRLLQSIDSALLAYPFSGINIDIEYTGPITPTLRSNLTRLVTKVRQHINQRYQGVVLSIDMYAGAADKPHLWEVAELSQQVDFIVVMAYDFHRRSSPLAGPVAPLFGGKKMWDSDISEHLQAFLKVVPSQKIVLGVPFYGYEWQTTSGDAQAPTFPNTGATASFERVQSLLARRSELHLKEGWNEDALSPYLSYQEDGETFVVYYENSRSLSYKLDYVNQLDLGGIAIWALGYEGDNRELWDVIAKKI
jgi:spore germination protein YaaH